MVSIQTLSVPIYKQPTLLPQPQAKSGILSTKSQDRFVKQANNATSLKFAGDESDDELLDNLANSFAKDISLRTANENEVSKDKLDYYSLAFGWPEFDKDDGKSVDALHEYLKKNQIKVNDIIFNKMDDDQIIYTKPLNTAASAGDVPLIKALLRAGANIESPDPIAGSPPLVLAAKRERLAAVKTLIEKRANVNNFDAEGTTALRHASEKGFLSIVKELLRAGANPNIATFMEGTSPLTTAAYHGHTEICKALIVKNANVNQADRLGFTPLYIASRQGKDGVVEALLEAGADVDKPACDNSTPLLIARVNEHLNIARMLQRAGADENKPNTKGFTPFTVQLMKGQFRHV